MEEQARPTRWLDDMRSDIRFALRTLRVRPGFAAAAITTLAIGIGAIGAIYAAVDAVLLRPLPYEQPDRLVRIWSEGSYPAGVVDVLRARANVYSSIEGYTNPAQRTFVDESGPERIGGVTVTPGLFAQLGVRALRGRTLQPGDELSGAEPVIVVSERLWQRRFGGASDIIGRTVSVNGTSRVVIGVMPASFAFPDRDVEYWLPAPFNPANVGQYWGSNFLYAIGRLRPDASLAAAQRELESLVPVLRGSFPWSMGTEWGNGAQVVPLRDTFAGALRTPLLVLLGAAGVVLLIACVNVANLLLVHAQTRRGEVAVRTALGAAHSRVLRQLLAENLVLAAVGGAAGVAVAALAVHMAIPALAGDLFRAHELRIDVRVLGFAFVITMLTALLFGAVPALRTAQSAHMLGSRSGGLTRSQRRLTGALVTGEIALAMILVTGAALLVKSFERLLAVDPGFTHERIITATVAPPTHRFPDNVARRAALDEIALRVRLLPGVRDVALASGVPFGAGVYGSVFIIEGRPNPATAGGEWPWADAAVNITPSLLPTLDVPVIAGRGFTDGDVAGAQPVVLVSERLARQYWPDENPIGRRITFPGTETSWTVVGVTRDMIWRNVRDEPGGALFLPLAQRDVDNVQVVVRTDRDATIGMRDLRHAALSVDREIAVSDVRTMSSLLADARGPARTTLVLLGVFALTSLLLGAIGVYGLGAYAVAQRRRELGVRMALGASSHSVAALVLRQGAGYTAAGVTIGILAASVLTRFLATLLFGVSPRDATIFAMVACGLAASMLLASVLPARRAARLSPVEALRAE